MRKKKLVKSIKSERSKLIKELRDAALNKAAKTNPLFQNDDNDFKSKNVHHPSHYGGADNIYEAIKVLEARMTPEEVIGFLKGSVYTYNDRAKYKGNELEDYEKGLWYQNRLVQFVRGKK